MPRNPGTGIYTKPYPDVISNTTIESAVHNGEIADIETDLNTPRPIVAGGTGANNATEARTNLAVEVRGVQVTNYDTQVWESGSFWSNTATSDPVAGHLFAGTSIVISSSYITLYAHDLTDTTIPGRTYIREKQAGVWGAWIANDALSVAKSGDTMTGNLHIAKTSPSLFLDKPVGGTSCGIIGQSGGTPRWQLKVGDETAEGGTATGSDFSVLRYNNAGTPLDVPFTIPRISGDTKILRAVVGTTAVTANVTPCKVGYNPATDIGMVIRPTSNTGAIAVIFVNAADGIVGRIDTTATATTYGTSSDERLKENLKAFNAGNIVDDTMVYDFNWKATGEQSYGIIAQQAVDVYPAAVIHDKQRDWWGIDYSKYVPVLLQELKALRARVAELEGRPETGAQPA